MIPLFIALPAAVAILVILVGRKIPLLSDALANLTTAALLLIAISRIGKSAIYWVKAWTPQAGVPVGINLVLDNVAVIMLLTINFIAFMATFYSIQYLGRQVSKAHFYSLFLLMVAGVNGVVLVGDLFSLYIFIEIASIASYALVALGRKHEELEASFRYLIVGSIGSALILLAIAITYAMTGSLNMAQVAKTFGPALKPIHLLAVGLFIAGFGLKAALFPFHAWLADASPAASAPVSAMLSGVVIKTIGVYAMARVLFNALGMVPLFNTILLVLGAISIMVGALMALGQDDIKRRLSYHSISEIGYMVLAIGLGTRPGIAAALFLIMNHAVYETLLHFNAGSIEYATGIRDLSGLGGLKRKMPVTAATSVIASLSISAIPPFGGFWSRFFVIVAAVQAERYGYAAWAVAGSILTLASFARFQKRVTHEETSGEACQSAREVPALMQGTMIALAVLCVVMGLLWLPKIQDGFFMPAAKIIQEGIQYGSNILGK